MKACSVRRTFTFSSLIHFVCLVILLSKSVNALYDELCAFDHDHFVNVTTVYPSFINTRKELGEILDKVEEFTPRMAPEYVADEIVKAVKRNKRELDLPFGSGLFSLLK